MTSPEIKEAKSILNAYRSLARLTGVIYSLDQLESVNTSESSYSHLKSDIRPLKEYESDKLRVISAWQLVPLKQRTVLFHSYFGIDEPMTRKHISSIMGYSVSAIDKLKSEGTKIFLKNYKDASESLPSPQVGTVIS